MPARGQVPPPVPPHAQPRAEWEREFAAELVRLRPHLAGADRLLKVHLVTALAQHGLAGDPKAAAKAYHTG